jgi:hypothetical protein
MLGNLPFYNFLNQSNSRTFNHAIGLPKKNGQEYPLFDYEQLVYNTLQNHKPVWIKKAIGLGITEFMLRYMAWLCLRDKTLEGSQMSIVTGPRIDLAIGLIDRLKWFFTDNGLVTFEFKETVIELNGVCVEALTSHHLDSIHSSLN